MIVFWLRPLSADEARLGFPSCHDICVLHRSLVLIGQVQRFNFLQIGRQRNLIYAVFMVFVALLYLSLVRRASLWLEPYLPRKRPQRCSCFCPSCSLSHCSG